jgi:GNAT superfamily N-acetyltransferase
LWGIDYSESFPLQVSEDGITVDAVGVDEALEFVGEHYAAIFGGAEGSPFWTEESPAARERYLRHACDIFAFRDGDEVVGLFIGNPVDWSTYYIRSMAFLPEYQGRALYQRFFAVLFERLAQAGIARIEAEAAPSNRRSAGVLMLQRFVVSGNVLSERWGGLVRYTKHLDTRVQGVFLRQFCASGGVHQQQSQRRYTDA